MWRKRLIVASAAIGEAKNASRVRSMITSGSAYSAACSARGAAGVAAGGAVGGGDGRLHASAAATKANQSTRGRWRMSLHSEDAAQRRQLALDARDAAIAQ